MQEEANYLETEKIAITFPEIRRFVGCRMSLFYRCIQRFKGLESVGCLFHAASRKYSSGRLFAGILVGMALCERFFCRFLCPMGAVFSLLPMLPIFSVRRKQEQCAKGCSACTRCCPADLTLPEAGSWSVNGECFQCQKCVDICPKKNAHSGIGKLRGNEIWFTILRAVVLGVVLVLAGI